MESDDDDANNDKQFGVLPVNKLFFKLAIPGIVSMIFASLGMIIDGIFVGRFIGSDALVAVNLVMPVLMILFALGDMIAVGSSVKISIKLGKQDEKGANQLFTASLLTVFLLGIVITIFGLVFMDSIIYAFVQDQNLASLARDYAKVFIFYLPFVIPFFAIDNYLRICGKIKFSMYLNIGVAVLNILLDAILVGYLGLGIEYAALATIIGEGIAVIIALIPILLKKYTLKISSPKMSFNEVKGIVSNGSSEFFNNVSSSFLAILINGLLLNLGGVTAVASYAIILYIDNLLLSILYGMQDSIQPAISYNLGAKKIGRILKLFKFNCIVAFIISIISMVMIYLFPEFLISIFTEDANSQIVETAKMALLLYAPSYLFTWFNMVASAFLTGFDRPKESLTIMLLKAVVFPIISLFVMTNIMGANGVYITPTISGALAFIVALVIWKSSSREIIKKYA